MRNDEFGRLLKAGLSSIALCEGKNQPAIEDDLGQQIGVTAASIQRYKAGHIPPELRTLEILAGAAVNRGFLSRDWVGRFLRAAGYPAPERLLERLFPVAPARPRAPRVYANLPAPTYGQFVMRAQAFAEVLEGLAARSAAVLVVGLGGQGKTSLAREVADACLKGVEGAPAFDAAVWVSDKDRPGTTNLSTVLDEIARTLDYPGFTQFEHDEKRREVEQLLRKQRVLLVVDNFETVTDGALLSWLLRLPEPSKALITSREYSRAFRNSTMVAELRGMQDAEAQTLIAQRLRMLQLDKKAKDAAEFEPLVAVTGGNPKAIEIALGVVKHERRPLQQVIDDLYAARGELFDDLFARAWSLLDEAARRVLLVMTFFPDSASGEAVAASADVQGYAFDRAVERLTDLALLDIQQADLSSAPRYTLHPLVRVFANARLAEQSSFEASARERWLGLYINLVTTTTSKWYDLERMKLYDSEEETIYAAITWAFYNQQDVAVIELVRGVRYYYNIRGLWDQRLIVNLYHADAASRLNNSPQEARALAELVISLTKQGRSEEAEKYFPRLHRAIESVEVPPPTFFAYQYAIAIYLLAKEDIDNAQQVLVDTLPFSRSLGGEPYILNRRWLAVCLYQKGRLEESERLFREALHDAKIEGHQRAVIGNLIRITRIELDRKNLDTAFEILNYCYNEALHHQDRRRLAEVYPLFARLHALRGDLLAARTAFAEAIDLFERLGMRRELAEARAELVRLDAAPPAMES